MTRLPRILRRLIRPLMQSRVDALRRDQDRLFAEIEEARRLHRPTAALITRQQANAHELLRICE